MSIVVKSHRVRFIFSNRDDDMTQFAELDLLEDAQRLHKRYCDRQRMSHTCVGCISITKDGVEMSCHLCGNGNHHLSGGQAKSYDLAKRVFAAADMNLESFSREVIVRILKEIENNV